MTALRPAFRFARSFARLSAAATVAATLQANTADAAKIAEFTVGNWNGGAYADDSGAFTHCGATVRYKSGISLLFSLDTGQNWNMGFASPDWSLEEGSRHFIRYQVDSGDLYEGEAFAPNANLARVNLPLDSDLFRQMRLGRDLKVYVGNDALTFNLASSNKMLKRLGTCFETHSAQVRAPANIGPTPNPFGGKSATPAALGGNDTTNAYRTEGREEARSIMEEIGVAFNYVTPEDQPGLYDTYDSVWSMNKFVGTLRIVEDASLAQIDAALIEGERDRCTGHFTTVHKNDPTFGEAVVHRVAGCKMSDDEEKTSTFTIYPRPEGGHYVLQVFTSVAELPDAIKVADMLSDAALKLITTF